MKTTKPQTGEYWKSRPLNDKDRDWGYGAENWVKDYWASRSHPHRKLIVEAVRPLAPSEIAEVGCNCGPNLAVLHEAFPRVDLYGIDASPDAINHGKEMLCKHIKISQDEFTRLPWRNDCMDVVLADAVLMYAPPEEIEDVLGELDRVSRKAIILVERQAEESTVTGAVWAHDYEKMLKKLGYKVSAKPLGDNWKESKNWQKYGKLIVATK